MYSTMGTAKAAKLLGVSVKGLWQWRGPKAGSLLIVPTRAAFCARSVFGQTVDSLPRIGRGCVRHEAQSSILIWMRQSLPSNWRPQLP
ncbi:hypothetical protein [Candidatus Methylacidiphilum infernorum]|uniref:hypothetical protein n=1 Tax=Candidatus Methylacidiphilum infernorum TaxID=511746 RepID=UPI0011D0B225|nr:hypothetical protein [Candidatus Methylacidiphilum infernorum]